MIMQPKHPRESRTEQVQILMFDTMNGYSQMCIRDRRSPAPSIPPYHSIRSIALWLRISYTA